MMRIFLVVFLLLIGAAPVQADIRLPKFFSRGMVLQRDMPVPIWGWANANQALEVKFAGQTVRAQADADGRWRASLEPLSASLESRVLTIAATDGSAKVEIADVLVGEVWINAGQSNMMFGLAHATGGKTFYEQHHSEIRGKVRVINTMGPPGMADTPQQDVAAVWQEPQNGYSAVSYWFAYKLFKHLNGQVPIGMMTFTNITGAEAWVDRPSLENNPRLKNLLTDTYDFDSKCYNAVIAAVAPYALRGAIYYQAEYNGFGDRAMQFRVLMPTLISTWRRAWNRPDLPFLFVQLPGFIAAQAPASTIDMDPKALAQYRSTKDRRTWTDVREAQLLTWKNVPHTGMVVTIDLGEDYDIHPPNKEPVADRLLRMARHVAYGESLVFSGPVPKEFTVRGRELIVTFDHIGSGLTGRDGKILGFEIAGADAQFHPADARIAANQVLLTSTAVSEPVHVRYAWDGNPQATLYNTEGLPATPFRWSDRSRSFQPDAAQFDWPNASFEEINKEGQPLAWRLGPGTSLVTEKAATGSRALLLTEPNKSGLFITGIVIGPGAFWNTNPLTPASLRPGCLVSYSVQIAAQSGGAAQNLYMNLCQDASGSGYQAWGGYVVASTARDQFVTRTVVQRMTDSILESHLSFPDAAGARLLLQPAKTPGALFVDALSPVKILRPMLATNFPATLKLRAAPGKSVDSDELTIRNSQAGVFRQVLSDGDKGSEWATLLFGVANFPANELGEQQKIIAKTDHVGAILLGPDAASFSFVSTALGSTPQQLKLIGQDGKGGLTGGPQPEIESFKIRFNSSSKPGVYRATLRVVTQAGNLGTLSQAQPGEPPVNFYFLDTPVEVTVAAAP